MFPVRLLGLAAAAALACVPCSAAETSRDLAERHPAAKVVVDFLRLSVNRDWEKVAGLVAPDSLETLKRDYLKSVGDPTLPFDQAQAMCRAVGVEDEAAIAAMTPVAFYVAYNQGLQKRYNVTDAINRRIAQTLELNLLSIAEERADLVHLVVRTEHQTMNHQVRNLEIVSLVKQNGRWLVALGEQKPKYTPLPGKPGASAEPREPGGR
jgi:hypothetical protein